MVERYIFVYYLGIQMSGVNHVRDNNSRVFQCFGLYFHGPIFWFQLDIGSELSFGGNRRSRLDAFFYLWSLAAAACDAFWLLAAFVDIWLRAARDTLENTSNFQDVFTLSF